MRYLQLFANDSDIFVYQYIIEINIYSWYKNVLPQKFYKGLPTKFVCRFVKFNAIGFVNIISRWVLGKYTLYIILVYYVKVGTSGQCLVRS